MNWNPLSHLWEVIQSHGGFVNAHAHFDRAWTVTEKDFPVNVECPLQEKWLLVDEVKRSSSVSDYFERMKRVLLLQKEQGISACLSFVDCDEVAEDRALLAACRAREFADKEFGIKLLLACQTLKGVISPSARRWFERSLEVVDVIGGLPGKDKGREEEHLDILFEAAKRTGKRVHVHVDQLNSPLERETEFLAKKVLQWGLNGKVTAVHGISLAAHPLSYRKKVYALCREAGLSFVSCPTAWIDARREECFTPTHNAVTPIDELIPEGITVALGSDNIADVYKPFSDGDMRVELRVLLESTHYYNFSELAKVATTNGRIVLGLE